MFVTSGGKGTVQVIDTATNAIVPKIAVGRRPWNMALTPDGKKLYVACGRSNAVAVVDTATLHARSRRSRSASCPGAWRSAERIAGGRERLTSASDRRGRRPPQPATADPARLPSGPPLQRARHVRGNPTFPTQRGDAALRRVAAGALALAPPSRRSPWVSGAGAGDLCVDAVDLLAHRCYDAADRRLARCVSTAGRGNSAAQPATPAAGSDVARIRARDGPGNSSTRRSSPQRGARVAHRLANGARRADRSCTGTASTMDTRNDGNGESLVAPGGRYDYAFTVRNRAGLYWYHPHPHGATARQVYRGPVRTARGRRRRRARAAARARPRAGEHRDPAGAAGSRAPATAIATRPRPDDELLGWYGDVPPRQRHAASPPRRRRRDATACACSTRRMRAPSGFAFRATTARRCRSTLLGTDGGLLERGGSLQRSLRLAGGADRRARRLSRRRASAASSCSRRGAFDPMHAVPDRPGGAASARPPRWHGVHGAQPARRPGGRRRAARRRRVSGDAVQRARAAQPSPAPPARLSEPVAQRRSATTSVRCASASPRAAGASTTASTTRRRRRSTSRAPRAETWLLRNYHTSMPHAMHLHGFQFRVLERETSPDQLAPLAVDARGRLATDLGCKDTVLVWPGESVRIAIDFRHAVPGRADLPRPLPQPRARGRRHDAAGPGRVRRRRMARFGRPFAARRRAPLAAGLRRRACSSPAGAAALRRARAG